MVLNETINYIPPGWSVGVTSIRTPLTVNSNSPRMVVRFASNGSDSTNNLADFYAMYTRTNSAIDCDGTYNETDSGVITSPNFPSSPIDYLYCRYFISVPKGYIVLLTFGTFATMNTDFLEVLKDVINSYIYIYIFF